MAFYKKMRVRCLSIVRYNSCQVTREIVLAILVFVN